jgi:predicted phage terminase large subunit-like protein
MTGQKTASLANLVASCPKQNLAKAIKSLTEGEAEALLYDWEFWARPNQLAPEGDWRTWLLLAGRGFGKTRTGAEWVRDQVERYGRRRIALVGRTSADCRKTMVEGDAGLLSVFPSHKRPVYEPSRRQVTFANGAIAITYSSEEPDLLRGPSHEAAWVDELASFFDANADEGSSVGTTWSNLQMGLRLGENPQQVVSTTPRPIKLIKNLIASETTITTRGTTYENRANLAPAFFQDIVSQYDGTRLGRQELLAEILEDVEGAIFTRAWIERNRVKAIKNRDLQRVVIAIDPAVTAKEGSDATGMVVAGLGTDGRGYLLDDLTCRLSADGWASRAIQAYHDRGADKIIAEVNNGGDLVEKVIRTIEPRIAYKAVHASRGKITRAEPVAALYEQGRISHCGAFPELEDQMCQYTGNPGESSPDRMDAMVWAFHELMLDRQTRPRAMWI